MSRKSNAFDGKNLWSDVGNLPSHQRNVDFKIDHFDLLVGALNLCVKCHGEQENHKMILDYSNTTFSQ